MYRRLTWPTLHFKKIALAVCGEQTGVVSSNGKGWEAARSLP